VKAKENCWEEIKRVACLLFPPVWGTYWSAVELTVDPVELGTFRTNVPYLTPNVPYLTWVDDINENWEMYREKFLKGDFP